MLRPERMSKVSVTGSKGVMPAVIETTHELNLVHLSDYDGSWDGFDNGTPMEGADEVSAKLVTVRALESTLDLAPDIAGPASLEDGWEERLERVRTQINELDDRRSEIREEKRQVDEKIDRVEPFAELGIDLDLLTGYSSVDVTVVSGPVDEIEAALDASEDIQAYETFTGGDVVAIVAAPDRDEFDTLDAGETNVVDDALTGLEFTRHEVPETEGSPAEYLEQLEHRTRQLEADLEGIDADLERIKLDEGGFLLQVETELTIEAQRGEAPLQFATTERAFVAEGWIPSDRVTEFEAALEDAVGDSVELEELEVADYDDHGHGDDHAHNGEGDGVDAAEGEAPAERERDAPKAATDGGTSGHGRRDEPVTMDDEPPVVLNNLTPAKPFEMMVKMVSQPKYSELDPTLLIFLTYPFAFGFMIGDIGYGILYMLMGYVGYSMFGKSDSDAGRALASIAIWAGAFTVLFGYLYDDIFGVHMADLGLGWLPLAGSLTKGLQTTEWAIFWIIASIAFGLLHLNMGLVLGFVNELRHGLKAAIYERFSWILAMNGLFAWIFSLHMVEQKPEFLVGTGEEAVLYQFLGFAGLPEIVGILGLAAFVVGVVMVGIGEGVAGVAETPAWAFGHVLSYLRMVAVLLAKGGMAFVVNVLVFGAYAVDGYTMFALFEPPAATAGEEGVVFEGLIWLGLESGSLLLAALAILVAIVVFILGHILVLMLGITAAGIQMLRLEYVEFMQKFYEGGGEEYEPFGHDAVEPAD